MLEATRRRVAELGTPFELLLVSEVLTLLSLMVGHVSVAWWIAGAGGAHHLAIYGAAMSVTMFISMPLLSPLGDRHAKRNLLGLGLVVFLVETLLLATMAQFFGYHLPSVIALEMVAVMALAVIQPASMTVAAELVASDQLADAMSLQKTAQALGRMLGPALGGMALAVAGVKSALWLHTILLAIAAWATFRIPAGLKHTPSAQHGWWAEMTAGLRAKWIIPVERYWTGLAFFTMVFFAPAVGMLVPLRIQSLQWSAVWLGWCEASLAAGMLVGAFCFARLATERLGRFRAAVAALVGEGLALGLVGLLDARLGLPLCFFVTGACLSVVQLVGQTHRMLAVPEDFRARFTASNLMIMYVANSLGPTLSGILLLQTSVAHVYLIYGAALLLCALCYPLLPGYRAFLSLDHDTARNWYGKQYPAAFLRGRATS
ncbi:MFS transporter [Chitinimonas sp.]|uniref:MFS transporter n=1 Tax=Chitinimonas sp. TaxID=1934313 RepID=UPI002F94C63F